MTVLMHDAYAALGREARAAPDRGDLYDILYADDTLVMRTNATDVEQLTAAIGSAGQQYGMQLHWDKFQALSVCTAKKLKRPDGTQLD